MAQLYEIRIEGHLDVQWADWFDGMSITLEADGSTLLSGPIPDQPALYGLLRKVRDLGLPLVAVNRVTGALKPHSTNNKRSNTKRMQTLLKSWIPQMRAIARRARSSYRTAKPLESMRSCQHARLDFIGDAVYSGADRWCAASSIALFP